MRVGVLPLAMMLQRLPALGLRELLRQATPWASTGLGILKPAGGPRRGVNSRQRFPQNPVILVSFARPNTTGPIRPNTTGTYK